MVRSFISRNTPSRCIFFFSAEGLVDIVVADDDLQAFTFFSMEKDRPPEPGRRPR